MIAAVFAGASGAFALMAQRHIDPQFAYWTTSGEFVFVAVLAGNQSVAAVFVASMALELVRSFSNLYLPNTWQLVLGVFLLAVILFLPRGIGSLWIRERRKQRIPLRRRSPPKRSRAVNPVLSVRGLEKRFGAVVAADALTLDIPAGQKISLIGANGAGKTTFVNMVTGYFKPDSGTILLDGMDIGRRSPRSVARLGISRSFQIPQLFVELTAAENLTVAISGVGTRTVTSGARRRAKAAVTRRVELLERFGLADLADRPISELAGGVRKLIDIAMALVRRPKLLLLDEPTSGVSAEEKFTTMDRVIHAVAPDAATIVFVEHDMEIVSRYADRVVAFYQGRILADGVPADVLKDQEVRRYVTGGVR